MSYRCLLRKKQHYITIQKKFSVENICILYSLCHVPFKEKVHLLINYRVLVIKNPLSLRLRPQTESCV